jgi:hypothetical protein
MNTNTTITINGSEFEVQKLSVRMLHTVGDRIYTRLRSQLREDAEAAGLTKDEILEKIRELRTEWANGVEVLRQAYTYQGAMQFVGHAMTEAGHDLDVLDDDVSLAEIVVASALVCGLPNPLDSSDDEAEVDPDAEEIEPEK